ncbi:cyclomaltodextrinase N-terminal domain-containing protein [Fulvivirgaceae bacterium PWU4]|uniref:Cyclomaltodextrinase N-terminal domain-containing protein n=1 Tax=Chryseosolibacter histidini TaxID=2782349 RepID=A0AAP2DJX0_9BACT|nr:glycoside hydrolase family 13 protein [Chryseosolibacter histidini]MBT1696874.1 cyclomaltodextrinase N-terminal domain-containing protein [Chryseosolibacter histidini]
MLPRPRIALVFFFLLSIIAQAQKKQPTFHHVEPPFWWTGMKNPSVQILFHNKDADLSSLSATVKYDGVTISETKTVENPHYLFVTLNISPTAKAGKVPVTFTAGKKTFTYQYEIKSKSGDTNRIQGFNSSDVLYLIMPDRFANGDPANDSIPGMFEGAHRDQPEGRHGGDLKGIADHLDYIKDLGVTALWLNPVLENNQRKSSYHGYAITDLYQVDRRFGGNEAYLSVINKCHSMGLKVIQDMVMNHIGNDHWLMHDLPAKGWIHQFPEFTRSNYQGNVISDPYQSKYDATKMSNGWFDTTMPDVDQTDPLFATYLIQNTLWWIEHAGIDGIRMDTQPYPDKHFMAQWAKVVMHEYPQFNIVGEVWINSVATTAYWQKGMINKDSYQSNLPTVTDFPFCFTVPQALNEPAGWDTGMRRLYTLLSQDFIYPDANRNLTFLDNHDMSRFFLSAGKDLKKFKLGLAFLLTTRGIPQLYYGTELLMDGDGGYHPNVRKDFPGGWPGDKTSAFSRQGRTEAQNEAFDFMKTLLHWRKSQPAVHNGKLTHFIPENNIYVYFRESNSHRVMVILNANDQEKTLSLAPFTECLRGAGRGVDVISQAEVSLRDQVNVPAYTAMIIEVK